VNKVYQIAKSKLRTAIETKLAEFPTALIETHGKDLTVSGEPSPAGTPKPSNGATSPAAIATTSAAPVKPAAKPKAVNTETVVVTSNFQASADDLYGILTDERRIPMWSKAQAQSKAEVGTEYSLFGGGVKGTYKSLKPGQEIVQTWTLNTPSWPTGHFATLTTTFDQGSDYTKLTLCLDGVPLGVEEETRHKNIGSIGGLKSIGYVQLVFAPSSPPSSNMRSHEPSPPSSSRILAAVLIGLIAIGAAFSIPWLSGRN